MSHKKILAAFFLAVLPLAAFSKTKTTVKDTLSIDFRLNTKSDDGKNRLNWANSSQKIKDKYDAVSTASVSHSTGELFSVIHGTNPKTLLAPKGLRSLLLFAVSSPDFLQKDDFQITRQDDGKIKITFTHRNVNYLILSDEKGNLDVDKSFFIKQNLEQKQDSTRINTDEKDEHGFNEKNSQKDSSSLENQDDKNGTKDSTQNQLSDSTRMDTDGHGLDEENSPENQDDKNELQDSTRINADGTDENESPQIQEDDENALPEGFLADKSDEKSRYFGKFKVSLKNDVLTLKGKIKLLEISETE